MVSRSWQVLLLLSLLTVGALVAFASDRHNGDALSFSRLRTAKVLLGALEDAQQANLEAVIARSASLGNVPYRNTEAWGDLPSLRLYLVGHDPARPEALRQALASRGCSVLSYVPDNTWLVAGTPQAVREAVTETGALAAAYEAAHKVAPEWAEMQWDTEHSTNAEGPARHALDREVGPRRHLGETAGSRDLEAVNGGVQEGRLSALQTLASVPSVASRLSARRRLAAQGPGSAPPQYAVSVQLMALVPGAALEAAEEDWAAALWQHLGAAGPEGCRPVVAAPRHHATGRVLDVEGGAYAATLEVYLCRQDLLEGLSWLADLSVVTWVAPTFEVKDMDAYSNIAVQTGGMTTEQAKNPLAESSRPYHAAGLVGTGEVVGMADTGIDLDNCLFHDTRFTNYRTMLRTLADGSQRLEMPDHRKVVQYHVPRGANFADEGGHGSHVAGTIAGSRQSGVYDTATGAGLATRLSLFDTGPLDPEGRRVIPSGVEVNLLPIHKDAGAAITTDSWAGARPTYDRDAGGFDTFLWRNPMMCSFVVAGNSGTNGMADGGTVGSPGVSKNPVTVGGNDRMNSATEGWELFVVRGFTASGAQTFYLHMWPYQGEGLPNITTVLDVGQTVPLIISDACGEGGATARGAFVLVPAGCDDTTAARNILNRGGLAMLVGENDNTRGLPAPTVRLASALVVEGIANWIFGNASRSSRITITRALIPYNVDNLSPFSSFGPLRDGRIKPDIIAPGGNIESAKSDGKITGGSCSSATTFMSGTSQATPTAAGHAALMRQYFRDGFYPDGDAEGPNSTPFTPSGMLIKAVAIAGAEDMQGGIHVGLGLRIGPAPNGFQGFGRMSLAGSLPLRGYSDADFSLQVADMAQFTATGQSLTLNGLTATGTGPVSVALVWYDYPGETWTYDVLVNDLDLAVDIGGRTLRGNNQEDDDTQAPDRVNTVERVRVLQPPAGARISITVRANQIRHRTVGGPDSDLPQRFAVAVVGYFTGNIQSDLNPARNADRGSPSASPPTRASPRPPSPSFSPPPSPRLSPTPPPSKVSSPPPPKVRARPPPHPPRPPRPPPRPRPPRPPPRPRPPPKLTATQRNERRAARLARREDSGNPKLVVRNG